MKTEKKEDLVWVWVGGQLGTMPRPQPVSGGDPMNDIEYYESQEAALAANMDGVSYEQI